MLFAARKLAAQSSKLGGEIDSNPAQNPYLYYWSPFLLRFHRDLMQQDIADANDRMERIKKTYGAKKSRKSWIATFFM
jgi:hypothetical protein